ncbi:MAG: hypothetical protein M1835_007789 [Candelina submexicana]|nr:MAG: hypothetical protein M1835_007789 [Candelina submexicana]
MTVIPRNPSHRSEPHRRPAKSLSDAPGRARPKQAPGINNPVIVIDNNMTNLSTFLPILFSTLVLCIAVLIAWFFFTHPRVLLPPASPIVDEEKGQEAPPAGDEVAAEPAAPEAEGGDVVADPPEAPPAEPELPRAPTPPPPVAEEVGQPDIAPEDAAEGEEEIIEAVEEAPAAEPAPA